MFDSFPKRRSALFLAPMAMMMSSAAVAQERPVVVQADPSIVKSERVSFASLDLNSQRGRKALHFRIAGAVERVCEKDLGRDGLQASDYYRCETGAWNRAQPHIDRAISLAMNGDGAALAMASVVVTAG
jgi:UrcA family protein